MWCCEIARTAITHSSVSSDIAARRSRRYHSRRGQQPINIAVTAASITSPTIGPCTHQRSAYHPPRLAARRSCSVSASSKPSWAAAMISRIDAPAPSQIRRRRRYPIVVGAAPDRARHAAIRSQVQPHRIVTMVYSSAGTQSGDTAVSGESAKAGRFDSFMICISTVLVLSTRVRQPGFVQCHPGGAKGQYSGIVTRSSALVARVGQPG